MEHTVLITSHAILLTVGWLILVPAGTWMSTVGKSRYPEKWFCWHVGIMAIAAVTIFSAVAMSCSITDPHFSGAHQILGAGLDILLLVQALGGLWIHLHRDHEGAHRPAINKVHRTIGLVLYLGGLIYGIYGLHLYISGLPFDHEMYNLAVAFGFFLAIQLALLSCILPAWKKNWHEEGHHVHLPLIGDVNVNVPRVSH